MAGAFQSDAFQSDAFQVDALNFKLDSVLQRGASSSFTLDALLRRTVSTSFSLDALFAYHFTLNAVITAGPAEGAFQNDAFQNDAFQLDAAEEFSFTLDAVLKKTQSASFTLNAVLRRAVSGSFTFDVIVRRIVSGSLTLDAVIFRTAAGSLSLDATLLKTQSSSFTLDAVLAEFSYSFTLNAVIVRTQSGSATLNAVLFKTTSGSFTLDAVITQIIRTFTLDAVLSKTQSGSATLNAVLKKTQTGSFTLDATLVNRITGSFTLNATLKRTQPHSLTLKAYIASLPSFTLKAQIVFPPVPPGDAKKAFIRVNNLDYSQDVIFADAEFTAQVNGQAGTARLRVRDLLHIYSFTTGDDLAVYIGNDKVWGGFVTKAQPGYAFKVDDTQNPAQTERIWNLEGVDYNILFQKRFLINRASPTKPLPIYSGNTHDDVMVQDLVDKFLILDDDNIDSGGVTHVGSVAPDQEFNPGNPGDPWGAAMTIIAKPTGAIFYIDPGRILNFVDDDTPDAPYDLSDTPTGLEVGYRDMEILLNGSKLINDAMVWGAGTGSINGLVTFDRVEDTTSITDHGRWQLGEFTTLLYSQAAVDQRTNSFVYGSPQNHRGGKDDALSITLTVYEPGIVAGQKIRFISDVFDLDLVIPIRRMILRFPTQNDPEFTLTLSFEVDEPWGDYEFWFPPFNFNIKPPQIIIPPPVLPGPGTCTPAICGITDTFDRTLTTGWGISDCGLGWAASSGDGSSFSVSSGQGHITIPTGPANRAMEMTGSTDSVDFTVAAVATGGGGTDSFYIDASVPGSAGYIEADFYNDGTLNFLTSNPADNQTTTLGFGMSTPFYIRVVVVDNTTAHVYCWAASGSQPGSPTLILNSSDTFGSGMTAIEIGGAGTSFTVDVSGLDVTGLDRCTLNVSDLFDRTVAADSWGTSTSGISWSNQTITGGCDASVSGGLGQIIVSSGSLVQGASEYTSAIDYLSDAFEATAKIVNFPNATVGSTNVVEIGVLGFNFASGANTGFVRIDMTGNTISARRGTTVDSASFTPTPGADYYLKLGIAYGAPGTVRAKIWLVGAAEPDWMVSASATLTAAVVGQMFRVTYQTETKPSSFFIDQLDFTYADKPCYCNQVGFMLDNFDNRTSASTWNPASSGMTWTRTQDSALITASVGSGIGRLRAAITSATTTAAERWRASGSTAFQYQFDLIVKVAITPSIIPTGGLNRNATLGINILDADSHTQTVGWTYAASGSAGAVPNIFMGPLTNGSGANVVNYTPPGDGTYYIRWQYLFGVISQVKIWRDDETEPGDWMNSVTNPNGQFMENAIIFQVAITYTGLPSWGSNFTSDVDFDYIDFGEDCVGPSAAVSPNSAFCETATRMSSSVYRLSSAFQAGTSQVYINGFLQRRGGLLEYTEDPPNGEIVFNGPEFPEVTDDVWVCYISQEAL